MNVELLTRRRQAAEARGDDVIFGHRQLYENICDALYFESIPAGASLEELLAEILEYAFSRIHAARDYMDACTEFLPAVAREHQRLEKQIAELSNAGKRETAAWSLPQYRRSWDKIIRLMVDAWMEEKGCRPCNFKDNPFERG